MFFRNAIGSLFHLIAVFSFFAAGSFALCLYLSESARWAVIEVLFAQPEVLLSAGAIAFAAGVILMVGVYAIHRGRYLRIRLGKHKTDVDVSLIQTAIEECLHRNFAGKVTLAAVAASKHRLEIELNAEDRYLQPIETKLIALLRGQLGVNGPIFLTARSE